MHRFTGKWISDEYFTEQRPRNLFYQYNLKMLQKMVKHDPVTNAHILFRKKVELNDFHRAVLYISADDYYKLYINGAYVAMGPCPSYVWDYRYQTVDVTPYLHKGTNTIAVHTYYQGLVNRYWVSGDLNHGLLLDLAADGKIVAASDESFLCANHTGYIPTGTYGYKTCFREDYDANAPEADFTAPDFDDSGWCHAKVRRFADYTMTPQDTSNVELRTITPKTMHRDGNRIQIDLGRMYVGYLNLTAKGEKNSVITIKSAQELDEEGRAMYVLRTTRVEYLENWKLSGSTDTLDQFDYKPMRYADIELPEGCELLSCTFTVRHYPFRLRAKLNPRLLEACETEAQRRNIRRIWKLCCETLRYGPQDTIHDCIDRERGTYVGDVGLAAATHAVLTGNTSLHRGIARDLFRQRHFCDTLGAGTCCSLIHYAAEYPLIFVRTLYFSYCITGDKKQLEKDYNDITEYLECFRRDYEIQSLIGPMDKWCVAEWPKEYRDGYDVKLDQHEIEEATHIVLNMHYYKAVCTANIIAAELGKEPYRDEKEIGNAIIQAMYDTKRHLFRDSTTSEHTSYIGNLYPMAFGLIPDEQFRANMEAMMKERSVSAVNEFGPFPILEYFSKKGDWETVRQLLLDPNAWLLMLKQGATATFEAWGKNLKWNTSLFHNSLSYAALFMADMDMQKLLK